MDGIRIPDDWRWMSVRHEIDVGRLWKARDRLSGHLVDEPANQDVLDMLGAIWFAMGDLPQAGRYWWLTERDDVSATAAREAFYERFGVRPDVVLRALPRPTRPDLYPASVRARLEDLVSGLDQPFAWRPPGWTPADRDDWVVPPPPPLRERVAWPTVIVSIIAALVVGVVTIVSWVVGMVVDVLS